MFDKAIIDKISSAECSHSELRDFCKDLEDKELDTVSSFEKYYSIDSILKCIELYKTGKISDRHLADWANAYNWIIMAEYHTDDEDDKTVSIATLLRWEISDWLDSLSFYDKDYMEGSSYIEVYIKTFKAFDALYKNRECLTAFYAYANEYDCDASYPFEDVYVLLISEEARELVKIYSNGCNYQEYRLDATLCDDPSELHLKADELKKNGYTEIDYGFSDFDENAE